MAPDVYVFPRLSALDCAVIAPPLGLPLSAWLVLVLKTLVRSLQRHLPRFTCECMSPCISPILPSLIESAPAPHYTLPSTLVPVHAALCTLARSRGRHATQFPYCSGCLGCIAPDGIYDTPQPLAFPYFNGSTYSALCGADIRAVHPDMAQQ